MTDATLVLVRHGQTTWVAEGRFQGSSDPPLSALGERQAVAVAHRLAERARSPLPIPPGNPHKIWHSPLARAAATARAIWAAGAEPGPLTPEPALSELAQGAWEGLTHDEVLARWPQELAAWRTDPLHHHAPGGEALPVAATRAAVAVERILADVGCRLGTLPDAELVDRSPVLGYVDPTTGGPADAPAPMEDAWSIVVAHDGILRLVLMHLLDISMDHYWSLPFGLCSITVVEIRNGRARLRAHNLAEHLPG